MAKTPKGRMTPAAPDAPVRFSLGLCETICELLAQGHPWHRIAGTRGMPSYQTLYNWKRTKPGFAEAVEAAQELGREYCADRAVEVAEEATRETVMVDRLRATTLMRRASYGGSRRWSGKGGGAAEKPEPVEVVFRVRHFERVVGPDGKPFVREIFPEGEQ